MLGRLSVTRKVSLRLIVVVALLVGGVSALAGEMPQSLLEHLVSLWGIPAQSERDTRSYPIMVCRFDLDVTRDGVPELFLGQNYATSNRGMEWVVYSKQGDGRQKPLGVLTIALASFCYFPERGAILSVGRAGPGIGPDYAYYHVGEDGVWRIMDRQLPWSTAGDSARMHSWLLKGKPSVYKVPLADLASGRQPQWENVDTNLVDPSLGRLTAITTESGACSAERFLQEHREAGCLPGALAKP